MVHIQDESLPAPMFQAEAYGAFGIMHGLQDVKNGHQKTVSFAIADHPTKGGKIHNIISVGIGTIKGEKCWRYCGENNDPNGAGSSSVVASWYPYSDKWEAACFVLAYKLGKQGRNVFRLKN